MTASEDVAVLLIGSAWAPGQRRCPLGCRVVPDDTGGYRNLHGWLVGFGDLERIGVEGTGAYGAGLARFLQRAGVQVIEVDRPNRPERRRNGKSDQLDAVEAARAALSGRCRCVEIPPSGEVGRP